LKGEQISFSVSRNGVLSAYGKGSQPARAARQLHLFRGRGQRGTIAPAPAGDRRLGNGGGGQAKPLRVIG
jgi:hypothetical protein